MTLLLLQLLPRGNIVVFQPYLLVYVSSLLLQLNAYCLILLSSVTNLEPEMLVHLITELHKSNEIVCEMCSVIVKLEIDKLFGLTYHSEEDVEHKGFGKNDTIHVYV